MKRFFVLVLSLSPNVSLTAVKLPAPLNFTSVSFSS